MFLPGLVVVFAGIAGQADHGVDKQLRALTAELHVAAAKISAADLAVIGHHGEGARAIVAKLHADGVIAGEYVVTGGHASVRLIVYNGDGGVRSLSETPLGTHVLSADELDAIHSNLADEVGEMTPAAAPARIAPERIAPPPAPSTPATPPPDPQPEATPAATVEPSADSVSVAELEALTAGGPDADTAVDASAAASTPASEGAPHLRAALGFGLGARSFAPGPTTVPAYASSAVGVASFAAGVQPTERLSLSGLVEHTLEMTTPVDSQMAATSFSRWELTADYALVHGATLDIAPVVGVGHRGFSIDASSPQSSPSTDYSYAVLGGRMRAALGARVAIHAHLAFEPVVGGTDPMEMTFGSATRWAVDTGAAIEVRAWSHVFARVAADYQRFSWTWNQAGARGAGGAVDGYPSGTVSFGADY